jgi:leucyl aminopeptidase|tara:strand:+ start:4232 stop:5638 length:1407 start_codon:yes stop_codon:yes gene_type:complete
MTTTLPDLLVSNASATPLSFLPVTKAGLEAWLSHQEARWRDWVTWQAFDATPGEICLLPTADGGLEFALVGVESRAHPWSYAQAVTALPEGLYRLAEEQLDSPLEPAQATALAFGWQLGGYRFDRYKSQKSEKPLPQLLLPQQADAAQARLLAEGIALTRRLITTPTSDLGPAELEAEARALADRHGAAFTALVGEALLAQNYPMIHAVGRASAQAPRLLDLRWGDQGPRVTLVGKGVCFDSGGLDLKSADGMRLMKKDMGGAAHVLGLASMVMSAKLPLRLRVLVPAVENAVSGSAFRPGDVLTSRKGLTVEIGNTDAEGRLVLADALTEAQAENPDLILDFATLTGAARIAVGTEVPALFCNDERLADALVQASLAQGEPVWRLPLHAGYNSLLESPVADLNNAPGPYGGAITAALFLQNFVEPHTAWAHYDIMAWNLTKRPGHPLGGEAMGLLGALALLAQRAAE